MLEPELVVLEADLQGESGWLTCAKLTRERPGCKVVLVSEYCGGGFGSKGAGAISMVVPALLSKKAGAPVMMRISREEEQYIGRARTGMVGRARVGFGKDGRITALDLFIVEIIAVGNEAMFEWGQLCQEMERPRPPLDGSVAPNSQSGEHVDQFSLSVTQQFELGLRFRQMDGKGNLRSHGQRHGALK